MSKPLHDCDPMRCAGCQSEWITQRKTVTYSRSEDEDFSSKAVIAKCGAINIKNVASQENPSARRHSAVLIFDCEHCAAISGMFFIQHKGQTYTKWELVK